MRLLPGEQFIQNGAQGIHVAGGSDRLSQYLFRTGVFGSQRPARGHGGGERGVFIRRQEFGHTKIQEFGSAVGGNQDVAGLQIAVHHQIAMRIGDGFADLQHQAAAGLDGEFAGVAPVVDRLSRHILHHQKGPARGIRSAVDKAGDVRMIEAGQDLALMAEAADQFRRLHAILHQLEGRLLLKLVVGANRQVDHAHAAAADLVHHPPCAETRAHHRVRAQKRLRRILHQAADIMRLGLVRFEQRLHFATQRLVSRARTVEKADPFGGRQIGRLVK